MIKVKILFTIIFMSLLALPSFADDLLEARAALDAGDYTTAIKKYKIGADKGNVVSQYMLGVIYEYHVGPNYIEALKWYRLAAEQGDTDALFALGIFYEYGTGVAQNYKEAIKWFQKSAEKGDLRAEFYLGLMYLSRDGVEYDPKIALEYIRRSASKSYAPAQNQLAGMYDKGTGLPMDKKKALQWYRVAFENGNNESKYKIDELTKSGYEAPPLCVKVCQKSYWDIENRKNRSEEISTLDITQRSEMGESILHTAALFASTEELRILIDSGVGINVRSNDGRSALHTAAMSNNSENIRLLLKSGANVHARSQWGQTPIGYSDGFGFQILKKYGADINARDINGYTRLHTWIYQTLEAKLGYWYSDINPRKYSLDDLNKFIQSGIDLNAKTNGGQTALHQLIGSEMINFDAINLLVSNGADLSLTDANDNTPLYLAASLESEDAPKLVKALLLAGANPNSINERKKTPWYVAKKNDFLIGTDAYWMLHDARF